MTAREPFSDSTLEAMLQRRAHRADPGDLRETAMAALDGTRPRHLAWTFGDSLAGLAPAGWFVPVAAALLLVALGMVVVGSSWLREHLATPAPLRPAGIELMTPASLVSSRLVVDGAGTLWALGTGQLTRIDAVTGDRQTWTVAEDPMLSTRLTAPARDGGAWVWTGEAIRRFTGTGFGDPIAAPRHPLGLSEGPDGTLWILSTDAGLERWVDGRWEPVGDPLPLDDPDALLASAATLIATGPDEVWVSGSDKPGICPSRAGCGVLARLDHGRWSFYPWPRQGPDAVIQAPDGTIWAGSTETGLAWFHDGRWEDVDGPRQAPVGPLAAAADGTLWGLDDRGSLVRRDPDGAWTTIGSSDGLGTAEVLSAAVTSDGVIAMTTDGLFRKADGRWALLGPVDAPGPAPSRLNGIQALAAVSADEAWAVDQENGQLWHFADGTWQVPRQPTGFEFGPSAIAVGPDGSVWAASAARIQVLRSGGWATVWALAPGSPDWPMSSGLAVMPDGSVWAGTYDGLVHVTRVGEAFTDELVSCPVNGGSVAVAIDGTVWLGGDQLLGLGSRELAHATPAGCDEVDPRSSPATDDFGVHTVVAHPDGGVVVAYEEAVPGFERFHSEATVQSIVVRLDGGRTSVLGRAFMLSGSDSIAITQAGDVWWAYEDPVIAPADVISGPGGLVRLHGDERIQVLTGGAGTPGPISISPDGAVWFTDEAGIYRIEPGGQP